MRFFIVLCLFFFPIHTFAYSPEDFAQWKEGIKREAVNKGISKQIIEDALNRAEYLPRVVELDRKQPEGSITFETYRGRILSDKRIKTGRELYAKHKSRLTEIEALYGVPPKYVIALWGIETNYGGFTGGTNVINALATLAYDGRREKFFKAELFRALKILDEGHISLSNMKGSWAGAMGQNQFMPSSFENFAVDGNADGRRDIWTSLDDVFASTSNYLAKNGWKTGQRWGREVKLSRAINKDLLSKKLKKPLSFWRDQGVVLTNGRQLPLDPDIRATLYCPDGVTGDCFLGYHNYRVFLSWNRSTYFASSVGLLADAISR